MWAILSSKICPYCIPERPYCRKALEVCVFGEHYKSCSSGSGLCKALTRRKSFLHYFRDAIYFYHHELQGKNKTKKLP
jgi:hypothetical protein